MLFLLDNFLTKLFRARPLSLATFLFFLFVPALSLPGTAWAGEISILAPYDADVTMLSRNKIAHMVVRVADAGDLDKLHLYEEKGGRSYEPEGRYAKDGINYVHYSLHLKKGENSFVLGPTNLPLKIRYKPFGTLLNVNFASQDVYLFHRLEVLPPVCGGCHDEKMAVPAKIVPGGYGQPSSECYSCHQSTTLGAEWKHSPAASLFCRACHRDDPGLAKVAIPTGRVEEVCFGCHINNNKWLAMKHIHGPVGTGDCTICHDPHGGNNRYQLWAEGKAKLCVVCHEDMKKYLVSSPRQKLQTHVILTARGCVVCHSPHATDYRFQLVAEINDLCVGCHPALKGMAKGHPATNHPLQGVADPLRPGTELSCTSCHNPHGSDYSYLLIGENRGGLVCAKCHSGAPTKTRRFAR